MLYIASECLRVLNSVVVGGVANCFVVFLVVVRLFYGYRLF